MSIVQKIILWFLGLALVPTLLVGGILFLSFRHNIVDQAVSKLEYKADVQQQRVEDAVAQNKVQLEGFTNRVLLPLTLNKYNQSHMPEDLALLNSTISAAKSQTPKYQDITILSLEGKVVASTVAAAVGHDYSTKDYFADAKTKNNSTDFVFIDSKGQLAINLVGPILYQKSPVGIIVIEASAASLQAVTADYSGLGKTGETGLAKRDSNGDALYLTPLRFNSLATLRHRVGHQEIEQPIIQAINGYSRTIVDAFNYNDQPVIAVSRPIKGTHWGLSVETARSEVYQPLYNLRDTLLLLTFCILVFVVFIALYASRLITDPIITMSIAANALSKGDLTQRVHQVRAENSNNEFGVLAHAFNVMSSNLEKLDKMKTEFILLTSHQLRTPASAVKGFLSLLIEGHAKPLNAKQKDLLLSAYEENERQLRLINQILSISQAESKQMTLSVSAVDLTKLTKKIVQQLQPIAQEHQQKVTLSTAKSVTATVDPEKMHMIIENLVSNAIKYSADKTEIKISVVDQKDAAIIEVRDQGFGMSARDMEQLFKKFSRLSNPNSVKAQGSGLGLYLVKMLVELHGGTIVVQSTAGKGTAFIIKLPHK